MTWQRFCREVRLGSAPRIYLCEEGWSWRNARFADYDLWVVLEGEGWIRRGSLDEGPVGRGDAFLFAPGDSVQGRHNPRKRLKVFACHFEISAPLRKVLKRALPPRWQFHDLAKLENLLGDFLEGHRRGGDLDEIYLTLILEQAARERGRRPGDVVEEKLRELCLRLETDPGRNWEPVDMARLLGLSLPQFNRRFRLFAGTSAVRFLIQKRVDRARLLLQESAMSLQQIAEALGYGDVQYFHRQFRSETGRTPGSVRRPERASRGKGRTVG